jgi:cyanate lyase
MKIQLGIRGNEDAMNHILLKIDDLILMNKDNLFFTGNEGRDKTGKNLVQLLNALAKDHEISVKENVANLIESELNLENQELQKFVVDK